MKVVVLPGDGIGPEIVAEGRKVLEAVATRFDLKLEFEEALLGGIAIDETGTALPEDTLEKCRAADAVLLGAIGGPKWDTTDPHKPRPEQGLLGIRKGLGLYANIRPVKVFPALVGASTLKREVVEAVDLVVVRELTGGIYFGERARVDARAYDTCEYTTAEVERIARTAFEIAKGRRRLLHSVDKANVLETSRLWRETVVRVATHYPDVKLEHQLVDNTAMQLIRNPGQFDVIVTENLFGDILSDEAAMLVGSLGMLPSASLGEPGYPGLFEPIHGSAPDIAGEGIANPLATILSVAMMLRHSLGSPAGAESIEAAVEKVLADGLRTPDIMGTVGEWMGSRENLRAASTSEMGDAVVGALAAA